MGMNQPPMPQDPSALLALMGQGQEQQDPSQMQPEQPPEDIVTYEDAIDSVLKLIVSLASDQGLDKNVQAKSIAELGSAVKYLQDSLTESTSDQQAQNDMQNQQQQFDQSLAQEKHNLDLQHQHDIHKQTMDHNSRNQALKEFQAEKQLHQQQQKQESSLVQQAQQMDHAQQNHEMGLQSQAQQQELAQQDQANKSNNPTE